MTPLTLTLGAILALSPPGVVPATESPVARAAWVRAAPLFHEISRTQVIVAIQPDGTFIVDIVNDPDWLLYALDPSLEPVPPDTTHLTPPERNARLVGLMGDFVARTDLRFDGRLPDLDVEYVPPPPELDAETAPTGRVRLRGTLPEAVESFTWAYALADEPYPLLLYTGEGEVLVYWVNGPDFAGPYSLEDAVPLSIGETIRTYLALGFTHILPKGLDHILFVVGIFLLTTQLKPIVIQVTTFTLAHTITLALTVLGLLTLPSRIVETLIAASIVYVAVENLVTTELKPSRIALVFGFGLLHGMGFAGVLADLGLPRGQLAAGLVSFNVGVEIGQLAVIALLAVSVGWFSDRPWYRKAVVYPGSIGIAVVGLYWTVTRLLGVA